MDKTIHSVLCKLKVLGKVESGQNLVVGDVNFQIYDCKKNQWDRFLKWWLGETRHATANKLASFHLEIKDIITALLKDPSKNQTHIDRIFNELQNSLKGLTNLMSTYNGDKTIGSQLELLSENFNIELERLSTATSVDTSISEEDKSTLNDSMSNFYRL